MTYLVMIKMSPHLTNCEPTPSPANYSCASRLQSIRMLLPYVLVLTKKKGRLRRAWIVDYWNAQFCLGHTRRLAHSALI